MTTQLLRPTDEGKLIEKLFKVNLEAIKKSAPRGVADANRLIRIAFNAIVYDDKLRKCTQASIIGGVMEAVKLGITLGGPMQEGWLIPFMDSRSNQYVATLVVGYMGYRNIIDRGRSVLDLHPYSVFKGDFFEYELGSRPYVRHKVGWMCDPPTTREEWRGRGAPPDMLAAYAVAHLRGGGMQLEVLNMPQIESHRLRSRAKDSGPWVTDYEQMALKTTIRVIAKRLPKSSEILARALDLDDKADRGVPQDFDVQTIEVFDADPAEKLPTSFENLKAKMTGAQPPAALQPEAEATLTPEENAALDKEIFEREQKESK